MKTKQTNIDRSDAKGLVSRHNAPNSAMNLSPFLCFLLHICCVYGVKAINLLYHNLGDLDFNGRRQAICARVWFGSFLTIICRRKRGVYKMTNILTKNIYQVLFSECVSSLFVLFLRISIRCLKEINFARKFYRRNLFYEFVPHNCFFAVTHIEQHQ